MATRWILCRGCFDGVLDASRNGGRYVLLLIKITRKVVDILNLLRAASFVPRSVQSPNAWCGHFPFANWVVNELRPELFVELGTHSGNSYFSICQSVLEARIKTRCYSVDTWFGDDHAGDYGDDVYAQVNSHNIEHYAHFSTLLRMNFDEALVHFQDSSIDLLHIDGLHTYEAVLHDFEMWYPKLAPGAIVMLHDTAELSRGFGVWRLWEELCVRFNNNIEFFHSHGLGVFQIDGAGERAISVFDRDALGQEIVKGYFSALGAHHLTRIDIENAKIEAKSLQKAVSERDGHIATLQQWVSERDGHITTLQQWVAERDGHIATLQQWVAERDGQIATIEQDAVEHGAQVAALQETLADRDALVVALRHEVSARQGELDKLFASRSWRITVPLRKVAHQCRLLRDFFRFVPLAIRHGGGLKRTAQKALRIFRAEGVAGIRRRRMSLSVVGSVNPAPGSTGHDRNDYGEWVKRYDTLDEASREILRKRIESFSTRPIISIIMPVYDPPLNFLDEAIWSARRQIYPCWELCIADDASRNMQVRKLLLRHASEDSRIKVVFREENGHISVASNSALELASGEFVALLDNDDLLSEHALFWVADAILKHPEAQLLYSDEDKLDENGTRRIPYHKSDWNPDLFYSHNLITHLGVYSRKLVEEIGGFRVGVEGAQDYDLALRCIERIDHTAIHHIPRVLYHWRIHAGSTAGGEEAKPYAMLAGERAINEHFARMNVPGRVELTDVGFRARYRIDGESPLVSIIILTRDGLALLRQCIVSIFEKTTYQNFEIIVVDNGSTDRATLNYLASLDAAGQIRLLRDDRPFNFSALNNAAVLQARGEFVCLLNNDIEVITPNWLEELVSLASRPGVGAVGARLWYPNDRLQHAGCVTGIGGVAGHAQKNLPKGHVGYFNRAVLIQSYSAVTGACLLIRRCIYNEVGMLNEFDLPIAFNDIDFCLRVREAGYRNIWTPYAELYHHESASRGYEDTPEKVRRFEGEQSYMENRWGDELNRDPAYNPNLTLEYEDFSLAWPPRVEIIGEHPA